jgi:cytochrome P450
VFWTVLQIFSRQDLLETVRAEIAQAVAASEVAAGKGHLSIDALRAACPTLTAVFRECLRFGSENFSTRLVKADMMLADRYFLKKDSVIQIAGGVIHADKNIWGEDVDDFNPNRFLRQVDSKNPIHPAAFRAFGGGKTLCPGRHFATNEILMVAAMIVANFDMTAPDGGRIVVPKKNDNILPVHILEPLEDQPVRVVVTPRNGADILGRLEVVM